MTQTKVTRERQFSTEETQGVDVQDMDVRRLDELELLLVGGGEMTPTWP